MMGFGLDLLETNFWPDDNDIPAVSAEFPSDQAELEQRWKKEFHFHMGEIDLLLAPDHYNNWHSSLLGMSLMMSS
jgi:hypothetical protein